MRFAGLAYLTSASMLLTLAAGAFITSQGTSNEQAASIAEIQPAASLAPTGSDDDATLLATVRDVVSEDEPSPQASASPEPQPTAAQTEPVRWTPARRAVASPAPAPADPVKAQIAATPVVQITDSGFVPDQITVKTGEAIQWTNDGSKVHTATALTGAQRFDTGGLAAHQTAKVAFAAPGTYTYSSATDCLNGNHDPGFTCGKYFAVTVTG